MKLELLIDQKSLGTRLKSVINLDCLSIISDKFNDYKNGKHLLLLY